MSGEEAGNRCRFGSASGGFGSPAAVERYEEAIRPPAAEVPCPISRPHPHKSP